MARMSHLAPGAPVARAEDARSWTCPKTFWAREAR
jgi:hypothetical protein